MANVNCTRLKFVALSATYLFFAAGSPSKAASQRLEPALLKNPAVESYITMLGAVAVMTNKFPRLIDVRNGISLDCRGKQKLYSNEADIVTFCQCASTVTVAIWMTYPSIEMREAISAFIDKDTGTVDRLIALQSPDFYNSMCQAVTTDIANDVMSQANKAN